MNVSHESGINYKQTINFDLISFPLGIIIVLFCRFTDKEDEMGNLLTIEKGIECQLNGLKKHENVSMY